MIFKILLHMLTAALFWTGSAISMFGVYIQACALWLEGMSIADIKRSWDEP